MRGCVKSAPLDAARQRAHVDDMGTQYRNTSTLQWMTLALYVLPLIFGVFDVTGGGFCTGMIAGIFVDLGVLLGILLWHSRAVTQTRPSRSHRGPEPDTGPPPGGTATP
jgi:hypothetical protein